jgi:hypothetical protein
MFTDAMVGVQRSSAATEMGEVRFQELAVC